MVNEGRGAGARPGHGTGRGAGQGQPTAGHAAKVSVAAGRMVT